MQDFIAMALFVHVVERGGFTAAARHLGEPVSTVSRRIAELEKDIGVRLLERSTRSVRLTELGKGYYEHCRRGLQEFDSANLMIRNRQTEVSGLLRMTVPPSLVEPFFVPLVTAFQRRYPNARIAIMSTERFVDLLDETIDIAFRIGDMKDSSLTVRRIATYADHLVAAPDYLKERPVATSPADLAAHCLIVFGTGAMETSWSLKRDATAGKDEAVIIAPVPHLILNDFAAILSATLSGGGIAKIPSILCADAVRDGRLELVLPDWSFKPVTISAVTPGRKNMSRLVRLFLDHCFEHLPRQFDGAANALSVATRRTS